LGDGSHGKKELLKKQFRKTIFQFREISEDVLKDGRKQENGLGPDQILVNPRPIWEMFLLHNL
jgi:hypothetical protein